MSVWLEQALSRVEASADCLGKQREQSLAQLRATAWPTRKTEAWRYLPLNVLEKMSVKCVAGGSLEAPIIDELNSIDVIFTNGHFLPVLSELPQGLRIVTMSAASAADQRRAQEIFAQIKPQGHLFGMANDVLAKDVVLLDIADNVVLEKPLRIVTMLEAGAEAHTRVLVSLGANAHAEIIEHYTGSSESFNTGFVEYALAAGAHLEHCRFALQTGAAVTIGGSHFSLAEQARLNSTLVGFGSQLARVDVDVIYAGEQAQAKLNAIYLLDGKEIFDLHSCIEHAVPLCTTEENVRGIVADNARAIFNGRIHIHRYAQKTLAELNNRNLLLSDNAEINTKPELEIYADDVRCAHGATVAQIDKQALYYLQSRGISRSQAQVMLSFGFINELVDEMPNRILAEWLRPQLRERFSGMEVK